MKKIIFLFTVISTAFTLAHSQNIQPVSWTALTVQIEDNLYEIRLVPTFKGEGWHTYGLGPYEGGPIATSLSIEGNVKIIGKPYAEGVENYYDEIFGMEVGICSDGAVFCQKVEAAEAREVKVKVTVEWQACKDGSCILPDEETLTVRIPAAQGISPVPEKEKVSLYTWLAANKIVPSIIIAILAMVGLMLLGKIRFKKQAPVKYVSVLRLTLAIAVLTLMVYLIPILWI